MRGLSDAELVSLTCSGDRSAYGELVTRYQGHVYGLAYSLVGNWADAQDIAQETFIRAYTDLDHLRDRERFAAWLRRVTFGVAMNWLKAFRPRFFAKLKGRVDLDSLEIPDFRPGPPEVVEKRDLARAVLAAVESLPTKYRVPLTMFHLDGLSYRKVADFLDIPLGTAKWLIHAARKKLKPALAAYAGEEIAPVLQEVFNEHKLPDDFASKLQLKGWGHTQDHFSLTIQAAARALGRETDYETIYVLSTNAFAPCLNPREDCKAWWATDQGRDTSLDTVAGATGLKLRRLDMPQEAELSPEEYDRLCAPIIHQAMENGEVVAVPGGWKVHGPHGFNPWCWWGIVTEVRDDGTILGASLNGMLDNPISGIYAGCLALSLNEPTLTHEQADLQMLRRAVHRIRGDTAPFLPTDRTVFGLHAMDMWAKQMCKIPFCPACKERSANCAISTAQPAYEGTKVVASYLRRRIHTFPDAAHPRLEATARHYDRIVDLLHPAFRGEGGERYHTFIGDLAKQKAHAETITHCKTELAAAADKIEQALALTDIA